MKRGVVRAGEDKKAKGANAASPPRPLRSKTKRDAKIDGCKTRAKRRKIGVPRGRERWGRGPPRNPRCKEAVERSRVTVQGSSDEWRPPHQRWLGHGGGVGTRSCGDRQG